MNSSISALPQISVIVPVHNVEHHIAACIASLQAQSLTDFEVLVVDDGSTDASPARLRAAISDDPRFRVIRQDNRGLPGARNTGLDAARGELIAFLDGDDRFAPEFLEHMRNALANSGADWVACGLRNIHPDGSADTHSAIHDAPDPTAHPGPRLWPLETWDQAIAHFPSAWNKLYRRSLIEGLRFDEGTWFEDNAFYARAAARSTGLLHLPEPLYLQTRGRAGQITTADSDRVFEQFGVLDTLARIMTAPDKPGGTDALPRLAHRLIHERSAALRDPDRRCRFITAARTWLATNALPAQPGDDLPPSWHLELDGTCPLSIVLPWSGTGPGSEAALRHTLDSLAQQIQTGSELLIISANPKAAARANIIACTARVPVAQSLISQDPDRGAACNLGLETATGALIVFLQPGDRLHAHALAYWTDTMLRKQADFGFSRFCIGRGGTGIHSGLQATGLDVALPPETGLMDTSPDLALSLHCLPSAKIYRRDFLRDTGLCFGTGMFDSWQICIGAALSAPGVLYFAWPGAEDGEEPRPGTRIPAPATLIRMLDAAATSWPARARESLPIGWQKRLYARAIWEVSTRSPMSRPARRWYGLRAAWALWRRGWRQTPGPLDPYLPPRLSRLLGG